MFWNFSGAYKPVSSSVFMVSSVGFFTHPAIDTTDFIEGKETLVRKGFFGVEVSTGVENSTSDSGSLLTENIIHLI